MKASHDTEEERIINSSVINQGMGIFMAFEADSTTPPTIVNSSVGRTREHLTGAEVEKLMAAARKSSRYGHRDATMILIAYRHGLRASEVSDLQWHQVELTAGRLHVRRSKRGTPSVHPMQGDEIRALRRLQREQQPGPHVFTSERGGPMTPKSFHTLIARLGERAGMPFPIHPHMLRHACGFALANAGHDTRALRLDEMASHGIFDIQQALLRDGCFLPNYGNQDPLDMARAATATAGSEALLRGAGPESRGAHEGLDIWRDQATPLVETLTTRRGQWIALGCHGSMKCRSASPTRRPKTRWWKPC